MELPVLRFFAPPAWPEIEPRSQRLDFGRSSVPGFPPPSVPYPSERRATEFESSRSIAAVRSPMAFAENPWLPPEPLRRPAGSIPRQSSPPPGARDRSVERGGADRDLRDRKYGPDDNSYPSVAGRTRFYLRQRSRLPGSQHRWCGILPQNK